MYWNCFAKVLFIIIHMHRNIACHQAATSTVGNIADLEPLPDNDSTNFSRTSRACEFSSFPTQTPRQSQFLNQTHNHYFEPNVQSQNSDSQLLIQPDSHNYDFLSNQVNPSADGHYQPVTSRRSSGNKRNRESHLTRTDVIKSRTFHGRYNSNGYMEDSSGSDDACGAAGDISITSAEDIFLQRQGFTQEELLRYKQMSTQDIDLGEVPSLPPEQVFVQMSASDLPGFHGDIIYYPEFRSTFGSQISYFPKQQRLRLLKSCLDEESQLVIAGCQGPSDVAYSRAWRQLDAKYYHPEQVQHLILDYMSRLVNIPCFEQDEFSDVVSKLRGWFDRLLTSSRMSVLHLKPLLYYWMGNLPQEVYEKVSKIRFYDPPRFTFPRVLQVCEEWLDLQNSKRLDKRPISKSYAHKSKSGSSRSKCVNKSVGCESDSNSHRSDTESPMFKSVTKSSGHKCKSDSSRNKSVDSETNYSGLKSIDKSLSSNTSCNSKYTGRKSRSGCRSGSYSCNSDVESTGIKSRDNSFSSDASCRSESTERKSIDGSSSESHVRKSSCNKSSKVNSGGNKSSQTNAPVAKSHDDRSSDVSSCDIKSSDSTYYKCNLCQTQNHKTLDCPINYDVKCLKKLVQERHICLLCGCVEHLAKRCPIVTWLEDLSLVCKLSSCEPKPHASRFCALFSNK